MRISYLQEFTDLATSLSFTKVAAARHLSRSSLSKHIATLEEQLGCQLFLRDTNNVELTPDGLQLTVIGGGPPAGICGSGILAATRELLRTGIVRRTGAFVRADKFYDNDYRRRYLITDSNGRRSFRLTDGPEPLRITQGDIRQVQLAKGAILSGFTALLQRAGITMADLDKVVIAGQFGAHLPARSLTGTGILPFEVEDRIRYVGNTSATGAYMALLSQRVRREMEALARGIEYFELGALDHYEELLADCLTFPAVR